MTDKAELTKAGTMALTAKKGRMAKAGTMVATAKEGNELLGGEKLGDTRQVTKKKPAATKGGAKRVSTMDKVAEEAKAICGTTINASEGRKLRKRAAAPPSAAKPKKAKKAPLKKGRTMVNTAKEGKAFLKKEGHPVV